MVGITKPFTPVAAGRWSVRIGTSRPESKQLAVRRQKRVGSSPTSAIHKVVEGGVAMRVYKCMLCLADVHCKGDSNNAECECDCGEHELVVSKTDA